MEKRRRQFEFSKIKHKPIPSRNFTIPEVSTFNLFILGKNILSIKFPQRNTDFLTISHPWAINCNDLVVSFQYVLSLIMTKAFPPSVT